MTKLELTGNAWLKAALKSRYPQLILSAILLAGYAFAIMAGWVGTPVGSANFSIVFVWIAWWAILILAAVPLTGRGWCSVCPIPLAGEWLQRGAILAPPGKRPGWLNLRWPKALRNIWLQTAAFILLALFSSVLLTTPSVTAVVLAAMLFLAIGMSLVFERRAFCRYACPVGGFIGLYSQVAPVELRIKDKRVCVACEGKPCYRGSELGYGCPWDVFPGGLAKNTYCGLCMECVRTCPRDNIAINLRPCGADLTKSSSRLDEAFKALVMLGSAMIYAGVLLGPWGALKSAAYHIGTPAWFAYTGVFLAILLVVLPGLFGLCVLPFRNRRDFKTSFAMSASALIPLGLTFWIAFSLSFVLTNATYIVASLSDPLGLGWNLFGTAGIAWQPLLSSWVAPAQVMALAGGLIWAVRTAQEAAKKIRRSVIPVSAFCLAATLGMLWLLL
jgi:polyferredoxin